MSTIIMTACWRLRMPGPAKSVLISLADNANDNGYCWPSITTICERTCFGRTAVIDAITWLEENGLLKADRTNGRHTTYIITPDKYRPVSKPVKDEQSVRQTDQSARRTSPPDGRDQSARRTGPVRQTDTNRQEPSITVNVKALRAPAAHDLFHELFHDCPPEVVNDFLTLRKSKRAAVTATAVDGLRREAAKAGLPLAEVLRVCCERGWVGFKAHWEWGDGNRQRAGPPAGPSKQLQGVAAILGVDPNDLIERRPGAVVRQPDRPVLGQPVPAQPRRLPSSG